MGNLGLVNFAVLCALVGAALIDNKVKSDSSCDIDISETLRTLLNPQENDSIQVQSLRHQLLRKLQEDLDLAELEDEKEYKRSLASLAAWNNLPGEQKRNLESLAKGGTWYKNPPELGGNDDANYKRSIAYLTKNGLPLSMALPLENQKRGIEALARNGDLLRRQSLLDDQQDFKRNLASLARSYNFPVGTTAGFGKRSISSLAKSGELPYGKRNIQALARDGALGKRYSTVDGPQDEMLVDDKHIQSQRSQQRQKRQTSDYFGNEAVYHIPQDYEDILQDLTSSQDAPYPVEDKRFLGSVAKAGWFRPTTHGLSSFTSQPGKRHVAALARLGWLPAYRSIRRFNRSGRSYLRSPTDEVVCSSRKKTDSTNGKTQNYSYTKITSVPLNSRRYLNQNTVDNTYLKKVFRHPRMTLY